MADIQYWKDSIVADIESIRNLLDSISGKKDELERSAVLEQADKKLRSTKSNTRSFKMEIRLLFDQNERSKYEKDLNDYEQIVVQFLADVKQLRSAGNRNQLFIGAHSSSDIVPNENPYAAGDALLNEASRLQDKTAQSLGNTQQMINESKVVATSTVEELQRQREQIKQIDEDAIRVQDNLDRADKLIKTFGKRMATDKLIQCFACMNIMLIVGIVVYAVVKGGTDSDNNGSGSPESPVDARFLRGT